MRARALQKARRLRQTQPRSRLGDDSRKAPARCTFKPLHAPASLAFVLQEGIEIAARPCLTAFVLSLNGSAITLSRELWDKGVRDAPSLRALIERERGRKFHFGAVLEYSTQNYDLRRWLRSGGIDPDRDVQTTFIPSPIIHRHLGQGGLDGYCVGEPWNSISVASGEGWIVATSSQIAPQQMEKVFLVLKEFADVRPEEHQAIVAALIEASSFCEATENRARLATILSKPEYLHLPEELIARSLLGPLAPGQDNPATDDFILYERAEANVPTRARARQIFDQVRSLPATALTRSLKPSLIPKLFREDLYRQAEESVRHSKHTASGGLQRSFTRAKFPSYSAETNSPLRLAFVG